MKLSKSEKGFTLIELLVVIAILGILAAIVIPNAIGLLSTANEVAANTEADVVRLAVVTFQADNQGSKPDSTGDVLEYISKSLVGEYDITDGVVEGTGGWDDLTWEDGVWVKN